ncbi:hypothetical protein DL769_000748 [Monosporascus sp. CRB-8-3]|nr:hypothetical protein DL769_000748 [Monosporascus sp. CRB-8-3]
MINSQSGTSFEAKNTVSKLSKILIHCGDKVDALSCVYADGTSYGSYGGTGGQEFEFELEPGISHIRTPFRPTCPMRPLAYFLLRVWVWTVNEEIEGVQFSTNKGRESWKYGGLMFQEGDPTEFRPKNDGQEKSLIGFRWHFTGVLTALEPIWGGTHEQGTQKVLAAPLVGGSGGISFDMLSNLESPSKAILKTIIIRCARQIDAVECIYRTAHGDKRSGRFGGYGGTEHTFALYEGERIVKVKGYASAHMDSLQFVTNTNKCSEWYGGGGGSPVEWSPPEKDAGLSLLCFHGRSGGRIDSIGPVWATDPTEKCLT